MSTMGKLRPLSVCLRCTRCATCAAPGPPSRAPTQAVRFYNSSPGSRRPLDQNQPAADRPPVRSWQPLRSQPGQQQEGRPQQQYPGWRTQSEGRPQQQTQQQFQVRPPYQTQKPPARPAYQTQPTPARPPYERRNPRLNIRANQLRQPQIDPDKVDLPESAPALDITSPEDRILEEYTLDEQIRSTHVLVKDVATNKLLDVQPLARLLLSIDRETHTIRQLSRPSVDVEQLQPGEYDPTPAIVEVITKDELRERTLAKQKLVVAAQKAQRESKPKQIELNWAIDEHDLDIKLKQLVGFLEKGRTVEILLASKKRQRRATPEEAKNVVKTIEAKIADIGAKQLRKMEGSVGGQALMLVKKGPIPPGQ